MGAGDPMRTNRGGQADPNVQARDRIAARGRAIVRLPVIVRPENRGTFREQSQKMRNGSAANLMMMNATISESRKKNMMHKFTNQPANKSLASAGSQV